MATITTYKQLTLPEIANRIDPKGNLATIAEVLAQENEILYDAPMIEANDIFHHTSVQRDSLPTGTFRQLNRGVLPEASTTQDVVDTMGILETFAEADCDLVDAAPNPKQVRSDEGKAFLEGMAQTMAATLMYGNKGTDPEEFDGLAVRMASLAATTNVIGAGGTGSDLTSMYIVQWGVNTAHFIYPRGSKAGLVHNDLGKETKVDSSGRMHRVYRDQYQWKLGLVVKHPKAIARYANIETNSASNSFNEDHLIRLLTRMPKRGKGATIYCGIEMFAEMRIRLKDKSNVYFEPGRGEGLAGEPVMYFDGRPIRAVEQILLTEAALT
jgi:hypothetical protein